MSRYKKTRFGMHGPRIARPVAFTLIELSVVVVIMAVLFAIGIGMYSGSVVHHEAEAAGGRVIADFALARQLAIAKGANRTVAFTVGTGQYALVGVDHPDKPGGYTIDLSRPPYEGTILSADFGGDAEVSFDMYGKPDSEGTVVVRVGDRDVSIYLDPDTGKASVQ